MFVSIGGQETWVVLPEGCPDSAPNVNECPDVRGGLFTINASSSWESTTSIWNNTGYYSLETLVLRGLGIDGVSRLCHLAMFWKDKADDQPERRIRL